jgi:hypothetical protein
MAVCDRGTEREAIMPPVQCQDKKRRQKMIRELGATLGDALRYGDLAGHIRAWLSVVRGEVLPGDRVVIARDRAPDDCVQHELRAVLEGLSPQGLKAFRGLLAFHAVLDELGPEEVAQMRRAVELALSGAQTA